MPSVEAMNDLLTKWGAGSQVHDLLDAGFPFDEAVSLVYKAHTRGNAYRASKYLSMATQPV